MSSLEHSRPTSKLRTIPEDTEIIEPDMKSITIIRKITDLLLSDDESSYSQILYDLSEKITNKEDTNDYIIVTILLALHQEITDDDANFLQNKKFIDKVSKLLSEYRITSLDSFTHEHITAIVNKLFTSNKILERSKNKIMSLLNDTNSPKLTEFLNTVLPKQDGGVKRKTRGRRRAKKITKKSKRRSRK
jgi:hypothetical protein